MTTTWPVLELLEKAGFVQQTDRWGNDSDGWDYEVTNEGRSAVFCNFPEVTSFGDFSLVNPGASPAEPLDELLSRFQSISLR